jgi:hypothetical protein
VRQKPTSEEGAETAGLASAGSSTRVAACSLNTGAWGETHPSSFAVLTFCFLVALVSGDLFLQIDGDPWCALMKTACLLHA